MPPVHVIHGVAVSSALPLSRRPADAPGPDLHLEVSTPRPVPATPPGGKPLVYFELDGTPIYSATESRGRFVLRIHGLADFVLDGDLRTAICRPDPASEAPVLALVARGGFLAFWLGLRGECTLHASAVEIDGSAIAFLGPSGAGKSTLAAWACTRGARFVGDDLLRLGSDRPPQWVGLSPELRLRHGSAELLEGRHESWAVARSADGRLAASPPAPEHTSGPLTAVILPRPSRQEPELDLRQLEPVEAMLCVSGCPRVMGWRDPKGLEAQLDGASRIADALPVFTATVPWGPPFRRQAIDELMAGVLASAPAPPAVAS
jgi:hypothetical protein